MELYRRKSTVYTVYKHTAGSKNSCAETVLPAQTSVFVSERYLWQYDHQRVEPAKKKLSYINSEAFMP